MSDQRIPISQLSETQTAPDASYIAIDDGSLTKKITVENFNSTSTASAQQYANQAAASAQTVEDNIATSAAQIREATLAAREATQASTAATASASSAYDSASLAQNYSVNAATSAGQAMNAADTVAQGVTESKEYAEDSEAWAVGKKNGTDVPSSDAAYHNNAKYYSDNASSDADRAEAAADSINLPDQTLMIEGVAADSKATGDAISEKFGELSDAIELTIIKNICISATQGIYYVAWHDGDSIVETASASYMGAIVDLAGANYITLNANWVSQSYSFFADADNKRISKIIDSKTIDAGWVYAVPQGAVKAYISQNVSGTYAPIFVSKGVVVFAGRDDITASTYTVENYPYNTVISHVGILDTLEIPYSNIKDSQTNLADGVYAATAGATVSGNTATITAEYQGMETSDLEIADRYIKVSFTPIFNLQRCVLKLRYYDTTWRTTSALQDLISGQETSISIDKTQYTGTKYRILVQAVNLTPDVTNTVTINNMEIYSCTDFSASPYYDPEFTTMMESMMDTLSDVHKSFTVKKDGSGDFDSLVEAINTACQYMDSIVYVGAGEWDIIDEFGEDYMNAVSSVPATWGLVLMNRIHLIGTSKTVIKAHYTGANTNVKTYFSVFNAGEKGFTIEGLTIDDDGIRYSVHDDRGGSGSDPYANKYINCKMIHKNGMYSDCIGGGIGENCEYEIRGCYFEGDLGRTRLAYYHGNNNGSVTNAKAHITVCDNYFAQDGTFKLTNYGNSTTVSEAYVSNNSFGSAPEVTNGSSPSPIIVNMKMIEWNNVVRS